MIPLRLTIQAFGPYKDTQTIDFRKFFKDRLFLITGNTGSGKTMIFDAICYALFGEASGQYRKVDTLRSQFSDKSVITYVEFEFSHRDKVYRILREPEQTKLSRGREVSHRQVAKLYFDDDCITGIKNVNEKIKDILSIDYSQFKQIVMIAQGEFRKLVSADSKEREAIYRRIFNTMNFEKIQNILKDMASNEDKKKTSLTHKIEGALESIQSIKKISYEDFSIKDILNLLNVEIKVYEESLNKTSEGISLYKDKIHEKEILRSKLKELMDYTDKFKSMDLDALKMEALFLEKAQKALMIRDKENTLNTLKDTLKSFKDEIYIIDKDLNNSLENLSKIEKKIKEDSIKDIESEALKNKITELESLKDVIYEKNKYEKELETHRDNIKNFTSNKDEIDKNINDLNREYQESCSIVDTYKDIEARIYNLNHELMIANSLNDKLNKYKDDLSEYNSLYLKLSPKREEYEDLLKSYEIKNKYLLECEDIYFRNQAGFLSSKLEEGAPCMVCGSRSHPDKAKVIDEGIDEEFIKKVKRECLEDKNNLDSIKEECINLNKHIELKEQNIKSLYDDIRNIYGDELISFDFLAFNDQEEIKVREKISYLERSKVESNLIYEKFLKCRENISKIQIKIDESKDISHKIDVDIANEKSRISAIDSILRERILKLSKYSIHSLDDYNLLLDRHREELKHLLDLQNSLRDEMDYINKQVLMSRSKKDIKEKDIINIEGKIKESESLFDTYLKQSGFNSLDEYEKFKISDDEYKTKQNYIEEKRSEFKILRSAISKLQKETESLNGVSLDILDNEIMSLKKNLSELEENQNIYFKNSSSLINVFNVINEIHKEISSSEGYQANLNELSRIANGNNKLKISFERYILGMYFKEIIQAANVRLLKLTGGRYLFRHLRENIDLRIQQGLDISVFDNKTSRERKINAISGGESFQASLALALGLSDVIQRHSGGVSIDTLFIDEGFGSLDSDSLQNALECLIDANDESKLIGIISHVQELKDFITSKIEVIDSNDGSRIKIKS